MRELNAARDAQIPLRAEIESFRAMIEEEERRSKHLKFLQCFLIQNVYENIYN
jgi:hypothetical protein